MAASRLTARFYRRPTEVVARALIGTTLVHGDRAGMIVETEAYLGPEDGASHARFGKTPRNAVMFGAGGLSYVYLCYGVHHMFNVVTGTKGEVGAVLVRAIAPVRGLVEDPAVGRGPGKLARALHITREQHARDLTSDPALFLERRASRIHAEAIDTGPRVGVDYAGDWTDAPLRFWLRAHPAVSRRPRKRQRA